MHPRILDERSAPPLRSVIGELLAESDAADLALTRVRLASLDLTEAEILGPSHCRVLLGQLDAFTLLDTPDDLLHRASALGRLAGWLESERLQVRSAGIGSWTPDFSVYRGPGRQTVCLLGAHYFGNPHLTVGPSITLSTGEPRVARLLLRRFQELWDRGHDVGPAIMDVLKDVGAARAGGD